MLTIWHPGIDKSVSGIVEKIGEFGVKKILKLTAGSEKYVLFIDEDLEAELTDCEVSEGDIISIIRQGDRMFDVIKIEVDLSELHGQRQRISQRIGAVV